MKTFAKTACWQAIGAAELFAIAWYMTGKPAAACGAAAATFFGKGAMYYGHEMVWKYFGGA